MIAAVVGFSGTAMFDPSEPDGTPRKLLDVSRLSALGWQAGLSLEEGLHSTYQWYLHSAEVQSLLEISRK